MKIYASAENRTSDPLLSNSPALTTGYIKVICDLRFLPCIDVVSSDVSVFHKHMLSSHRRGKVVELESDFEQQQSDLKLAFKRISDLQTVLEEDLISDDDSLLEDRSVFLDFICNCIRPKKIRAFLVRGPTLIFGPTLILFFLAL